MQKVFDSYSKYYDLLYKDKDYDKETDYIESLLKKFSPDARDILELGCGTGKHAHRLNKKGYNVYGVDLSQSMLAKAKELGVECVHGDVRTFKCNKKFDVILSLFHVASYQNSDEDVLNYFNTAASHLKSGGVFIFDLWHKPAVLAQVPENRVKTMEDDKIKVVRYCKPVHLPSKSTVEVCYNIEIIDKTTNNIDKISEKHVMRYFSQEEISSFSKQNEIEIIHSEEWLTGNIPDKTTWGVCYVNKRKDYI